MLRRGRTYPWGTSALPTMSSCSVMRPGWDSQLLDSSMQGRYVAFSIEELSTIEFADIETVEK